MKNDLIPMAVNGRESHNEHKRLAHEMAKEMETRTFDTGARKAIRWAKRAAHRADRRQARDEIATEMALYGEWQDMRLPELEDVVSVDVEVREHPDYNVHCIYGEQGCFCLVDQSWVDDRILWNGRKLWVV